MPAITPWLWFATEAEDAANYYVSIFPNSRVTEVSRHGDAGPGAPGTVLAATFELDGTPFAALNGGTDFPFNESVSFLIDCADQSEVDHYWERLTADGGEESRCGWLKDRYGVSWQVVPRRLNQLLGDPDPGRARRAMQAMLGMAKIDVAGLEAAADAG